MKLDFLLYQQTKVLALQTGAPEFGSQHLCEKKKKKKTGPAGHGVAITTELGMQRQEGLWQSV